MKPFAHYGRAWINQPSTLQPLHRRHGQNVLAFHEDATHCRIYFLSGDAASARVPTLCLSPGWHPSNPVNERPQRT